MIQLYNFPNLLTDHHLLRVLVSVVLLSWKPGFLTNSTKKLISRVIMDDARKPMMSCFACLLSPGQG